MVLAERGSCPLTACPVACRRRRSEAEPYGVLPRSGTSGSEAKGTEGSDCPDLEILGVIKTQHFLSFQEPFTFL
jgi:hypothetical protein